MLKVGFAAADSHDIIPVDRCPILDPGLDGALDAAWALAEPLMPTGKPLDIQITATDRRPRCRRARLRAAADSS